MKKVLVCALSMVLMLSSLSACSVGTAASSAPPEEADVSSTPAADSSEAKADNTQIGAVTIYSPAPAEPLNAGVEAFTKATGIKVNVVAAGTGELLKRIESESANPLGDVVWGGCAESLQSYAKYFEPYVSVNDSVIPDTLKDPKDYWIGESPVPVVLMYNTDVLAKLGVEPPKKWSDLLNPKLKGAIAFADPAKSGSAFTLLCTMITAYGKDDGAGWDFITKLYANMDGKVQSSSSNAYKLVADGEYAVGLTQEKSAQEYLDAGATNIGYVYPEEGTSAVPDAIAIVKGCPNPEGAKAFVDFILSSEAQKMQAESFNRRPIRSDLAAPGNLSDMSKIPLVAYDFDWAGNSKPEIIAKWQEILVG